MGCTLKWYKRHADLPRMSKAAQFGLLAGLLLSLQATPCCGEQRSPQAGTVILIQERQSAPQKKPLEIQGNPTHQKPERMIRIPPRLKDLLPLQQDIIDPDRPGSDPLTVEPWVPERGALGVKVEVTW